MNTDTDTVRDTDTDSEPLNVKNVKQFRSNMVGYQTSLKKFLPGFRPG
jgi:hypothetical protein